MTPLVDSGSKPNASPQRMKCTAAVIAYNHVRFIRQTLDSVLMQQTNFDFEILISDDYSTDGTRQIIQQYANDHPEKIRLRFSEKNVGAGIAVVRALEAARGELIAFLDGDDYWTSPDKLQKQVAFMELHPELTLSWHDGWDVDSEGRKLYHKGSPIPATTHVDFRRMLRDPINAVPMSVMIRRSAVFPIPTWYQDCPIGDHPLWLLCLRSGFGGHLPEDLGEYRVHRGGYMNCHNEIGIHNLLLQTYRHYLVHLDPEYRQIVRKRLARLWQGMASLRWQYGTRTEARQAAIDGLKDCPGDFRLWIIAHAPWLWMGFRACTSLFSR